MTTNTFLMHNKNILFITLATACILMVPLIAMQFTNEVDWDLTNFIFAGTLLFGTGVAYEFVASRGRTTLYRVAVGLAGVTTLVLLWVNAAVGIIGDGLVNMMYVGVSAVGILGSLIAWFKPRGMMWTLFAMALAQMSVPTAALIIWNTQIS